MSGAMSRNDTKPGLALIFFAIFEGLIPMDMDNRQTFLGAMGTLASKEVAHFALTQTVFPHLSKHERILVPGRQTRNPA
jgi:hypothetical protein